MKSLERTPAARAPAKLCADAVPDACRRRIGGLAAAACASTLAPAVALLGVGNARADDGPPAAPPHTLGARVVWPARVSLLGGGSRAAPEPGGIGTVLVFFSTTCPFCARHNVHVNKLHELVRAQGLPMSVLGVAHDTQPELVQRYSERRGLAFDITMEQTALHAATSRMRGIPLTVVVDRQQRLREVIRGEMFEEDVLELARRAIG